MVQPQFTVLHIGEFRVEPALDEISKGGITTKLEPRTMRLLVCLAEHAGQILSVEQLLDLVWKDVVVSTDSVYQAVASLRRILGDDPKSPRYIANVMRRGYRLIALVESPTQRLATATPIPELNPVSTENRPPERDTRSGVLGRRLVVIAFVCVAAFCGGWAMWRELRGGQKSVAGPLLAAKASLAASLPLTIAVLPFDESTTEYYEGELAQALAETLRQRLGSSHRLIVIARGSSTPFAGQHVDAQEIGRRLAARYLVQGNVERVKDRLHVTSTLIDSETGMRLQTFSVDRQVNNAFALQYEIAGQIAKDVSFKLTGLDLPHESGSHPTSLDAYLKFLDAQTLLSHLNIKDAEQAALILEQVSRMDPGFALAQSELARARFIPQGLGLAEPDRAALLPLAEKAVSLDPTLGEAYMIRGILQSDAKAAEADFRKGIELAPNFAPGFQLYAISLIHYLGRPQEAIATIERAILIDPLAAQYVFMKGDFVFAKRHQETLAEELYAKAVTLDPDFALANLALADLKWKKGEIAEAIRLTEAALRSEPKGIEVRDQACAMYLDIGDKQAAQSVAVGLPTDSASNIMLALYGLNFQRAAAHFGDWAFTTAASEYAYWISVDAAARQSGTIAKTLARLRQEFSLSNVKDGVAPSGEYDAAFFVMADLLRAKGDQAGLAQVLPPLKSLVDKNESRSGSAHGALHLLSGDPDGALALLAIDMRRQHSGTSWILERDPIWAGVRNDPRFRDILATEREKIAQQREMLERMRQRGEVPRRVLENHVRVASGQVGGNQL
jgi:transcriptional activator of cad operon